MLFDSNPKSSLIQSLLNTVTDPCMVINQEGNIVIANPAVEHVFGWSPSALEGQSVNCLMPPDIAAQHDGYIARFLETREAEVIGRGRETQGMHKSGRVFPIHLSIDHCIVAGEHFFTGLVKDLSAQYLVQDRMSRHEQLLDGVLNSPEELIMVFDPSGRILMANQSAEALLGGVSSGAIVGRHWSDLFQEESAFQHGQLISEVYAHGQAERFTHSFAGREFDTQFSPVKNAQGKVEFVTSFSLDITELKRSKARLLKESKRAELANRAKTEFLANMSHELRTPLNSVLGFTYLLKEDSALTSDQLDSVHYIHEAGHYLKRLIEDILDLARIESGHLSQSPVITDVVSVLEEAIHLSSIELSSKQLSLSKRYPDVSVSVMADRTRLKQVFLNFLDNAVKYNVIQGCIQVSVQVLEPNQVRIRIKDTGVGIPEDKQGYLFKPFNRLGYEASGVPGTGIGLVLSRRLIEAMGGRIAFRSQEQEGSQFDVILPIVEADTDNVPQDYQELQAGYGGTKPLHVLYVEDNNSNVVLMQQFVSKRPHWIISIASNGFEAMQLAQQCLPDVILLDMSLPDMSGLELAIMLNSNDLVCHIPIIAVTADGRYETREACEYAGIYMIHTKPIDFVALERILRELS
ncbi:PAS domain S-box protein [Litoribrevibacter euphylliae]|uniref:histidine kinase n=1 Tax=Litoribrevibacter euphylliae TaxID=1834034 RepID=A0ABV7HGC6_9GAMM